MESSHELGDEILQNSPLQWMIGYRYEVGVCLLDSILLHYLDLMHYLESEKQRICIYY